MRSSSIGPWLDDILREVNLLEEIVRETSMEHFRENIRLRYVAERPIEIISKARRRIPQPFRDGHPELPWPSIASVGNVPNRIREIRSCQR